jgi:hypothetical protein
MSDRLVSPGPGKSIWANCPVCGVERKITYSMLKPNRAVQWTVERAAVCKRCRVEYHRADVERKRRVKRIPATPPYALARMMETPPKP